MLPGGGGGGGEFYCKPEALRNVAGKADGLGQDITDKASYTAADSSAASSGLQGWRIASVLNEAQSTWEKNMKGFGRQVADVGDKLRTTAQNYEDSDQRGAARWDWMTA